MGTGSLGVGNKMGFMGTGRLGVVYFMSFHGNREGRCSVLYEFSWGQ